MSFWSQLKENPTITQVGVAGDVVAVVHEEEVSVEIRTAMYLLHPLKILGISLPWVPSEPFSRISVLFSVLVFLWF